MCIAQSLLNTLGPLWTYIDRDEFIENKVCSESEADRFLDSRVREIGTRVIVDAQLPWRDRRVGELYFLLLPPLEVLLGRDAKRAQMRNRSEARAERAREFVIQTHNNLSQIPKDKFSACFDSSTTPVEECVKKIRTF